MIENSETLLLITLLVISNFVWFQEHRRTIAKWDKSVNDWARYASDLNNEWADRCIAQINAMHEQQNKAKGKYDA